MVDIAVVALVAYTTVLLAPPVCRVVSDEVCKNDVEIPDNSVMVHVCVVYTLKFESGVEHDCVSTGEAESVSVDVLEVV